MRPEAALFLGAALLVGCAAPAPPEEPAAIPEGRLDPRVAPSAQAIELHLDARREDFRGSTRIMLAVSAATGSFRFHAQDLTLDRIALSGDSGPIAVTTEPGEDGLVLARTANEIVPGRYTLDIDFAGRFNRQAVGLYRAEHGGESYLFTQFEAMDARRAFPCWDEPGFKIPFRLTLHVPAEHLAVTNTPVESETVEGERRTLAFAETNPLPTYLLAIATGPLETVPIPGMSIPGRVVTVRGQSGLAGAAIETTPPILAALERYFGSPYPFEKLDLIAVPEYWPGAMENPGAITYDDSILLLDPAASSVADRRRLASVTGHELAHIWFGDLVTMKWWDDLWLNESFASWLGDKIADEVYPEYGIDLANVRGLRRTFDGDARPSSRPIRKPVLARADVMDGLGLAYGKGQSVLGMVEQWIGPEAFRHGLLDYLAAHAWKNAEAADLWGALSRASGADVTSVLEGFIEQAGHPLVRFEIEPGGVLTLRQERFRNHGVEAEAQTWALPVRVAYEANGETKTKSVLLSAGEARVGLEADVDWLLPNAGAVGYYRWWIPTERLLDLAGRAADVMEPRERAAFLGNAAALLDAGAIGGDVYLDLLGAFAADPEPEVVLSVISGLDKVRLAFVPDELGEDFARYVRATLGPALARFGLERKAGEAEAVTLFRPRLFEWLGDEGRDPDVRRHAARLVAAYLDDPSAVDPSLAPVALEIAAIEGGPELFETYKGRFEVAAAPAERSRFLAAVGSFGDARIQQAALAYALGDQVRATEMFTIPMSLPDTEEAQDRAYDWVTENFETIRASMPPDLMGMLPFMASGCSEKRLAAAREFFAAPERRAGGVERSLEKVTDQVNDCVALRRREGAAVASYLQEVR